MHLFDPPTYNLLFIFPLSSHFFNIFSFLLLSLFVFSHRNYIGLFSFVRVYKYLKIKTAIFVIVDIIGEQSVFIIRQNLIKIM